MNQEKIKIGPELSLLKEFTYGMTALDKGHTIGNSDVIREVHNSFARQDPFTVVESKGRVAKEDDEAFHFISYVPHNNILYELDGLQNGPICFGACTDENWLSIARE